MGSLPVITKINVVVIDPRDPKNVFAAGPAGVFRSDDAGLSWQPRGQGLGNASIVALALNPSQPDTFFAITAEGALFRSNDAAQSWQSVVTASPP